MRIMRGKSGSMARWWTRVVPAACALALVGTAAAAADGPRGPSKPTHPWTNKPSIQPAPPTPAPAAAIAPAPAKATPPDPARFTALVVPNDAKSLWLINTATGSFARCEADTLDRMPTCSPWTAPPGETPEWRLDPVTRQMVPMNEAARHASAGNPSAPP